MACHVPAGVVFKVFKLSFFLGSLAHRRRRIRAVRRPKDREIITRNVPTSGSADVDIHPRRRIPGKPQPEYHTSALLVVYGQGVACARQPQNCGNGGMD